MTETSNAPQAPKPQIPPTPTPKDETPKAPANGKAARQKAAKSHKRTAKPKPTPTPTAPAPVKTAPKVKARRPVLLSKPPKSEVKAPKKGTKSATCLRLCRRANGATIDEISKELSASGSVVPPTVARSWCVYLHGQLGYGLKSELDAKDRLRVWAFTREDAKQPDKPA